MSDKKRLVPIGLRVSTELAAWLRAEAERNQRSVANQTAWALQQFRQQQQAAAGAAQ